MSKQKALIIIPYNYDIAEIEQILMSQVTGMVYYRVSKIQKCLLNDDYDITIANEHTFIYEGWRGYRFDNILVHYNCRVGKDIYSDVIPRLFRPTTDYDKVHMFDDKTVYDIIKYLSEHYTAWDF